MNYVKTQISMMNGEDDKLQMLAAKELAQLSSENPGTGISAGTLGVVSLHPPT